MELGLTLTNMVLQVISITNNCLTFKFIFRTFDTNQGLYRILLLDSIVTITTVFAIFFVFLSVLVPSIHYGPVGCFILGALSHSGFYITPLLTFLISFIRFMKLNNPVTGWRPEPQILNIIGWSTIGAYFYVFILAATSILFHHAFHGNFYLCLKEDPPQYEDGLTFIAVLVLGVELLAVLFSVTLDIFSLWKLRHLEKNRMDQQPNRNQIQPSPMENVIEAPANFPERKIIDELPIRSSLINTLFLLQYVFIMIVVGAIGRNWSKNEYRFGLLSIPYMLLSIFRTCLVARLTFKKNDANRLRNADDERERARQVEIQDALRKRRARNEERAQNPTSGEEKMVTESQHEKEASVALDMKTGQVRYQGFEPEKDTEAKDEKPSSIILNVRTIRVRAVDCDCQGACSLNH